MTETDDGEEFVATLEWGESPDGYLETWGSKNGGPRRMVSRQRIENKISYELSLDHDGERKTIEYQDGGWERFEKKGDGGWKPVEASNGTGGGCRA